MVNFKGGGSGLVHNNLHSKQRESSKSVSNKVRLTGLTHSLVAAHSSHLSHRTKKKKKSCLKQITGCTGIAVHLRERQHEGLNPYNFACSTRCRHPIHALKNRISSAGSTRQSDWIPEDIYKRYTETDSRPASPDATNTPTTILSRRSASVPRSRSTEHRKCVTPEPETKQCQFHQRRVLILDLRRVKSVDAITRQNSHTTGTSVDSTYGDDDGDNRSSSANPESSSIFHQLSPRNLSMSRSTTPKATTNRLGVNRRKKKSKERSTSPVIYERSSSPKILEGLTLPPLHSSVLTLLGQRPPTKASPRAFGSSGQTGLDGMPQSSSRPRKLRRPGRKSKKDGKQNEETLNANSVRDEGNRIEGLSKLAKSPSRDGAGGGRKGLVDDPHDTQMSAMSHRDTDDELDLRKADEADAVGNIVENMNDLNAKRFEAYMEQSARSLHEILDEQLVGTEWNPKEMKLIDDKIQNLKEDFKKYETKFKAGHIRMKEDMWLSLPRTWSRASATFGIPTDIRALSKLSPLEYIEKYIFISEPRKHLYSLVFHRYRTMENPTGKTITYNIVQRALAEVLGRSLDTADASRLQNEILSIPSVSMEVTEHLFRSICAVSERIFGKYSLEDCNECYACLKYKGKDKTRCHKNQKDQIERVDFEYVASKIKDGKVNPKLAELLQMVFDRG